MTGVGGEVTFEFKAIEATENPIGIKFVYKRPWENYEVDSWVVPV